MHTHTLPHCTYNSWWLFGCMGEQQGRPSALRIAYTQATYGVLSSPILTYLLIYSYSHYYHSDTCTYCISRVDYCNSLLRLESLGTSSVDFSPFSTFSSLRRGSLIASLTSGRSTPAEGPESTPIPLLYVLAFRCLPVYTAPA